MANASEAIAIIGVGARLPGAVDARQYWRNLREGKEGVGPVEEAELLACGVTAAELADPHYVRVAGQVPHLRDFDADLFGMTPREARFSDPQLKLMLEVSHAALEDAGFDPTTMSREVGVFGSAGQSRYTDLYITGSLRHHDGSTVVLNNTDYITTFTSYTFGFHGPGLTVMTACSSSLVATHLACQSLLLGECDLALAGGANVELPSGHGYRWGPGSVRSRDGHCRPFDAASNGTVFSDGAGMVVLKRLSDAVADGDHIKAVIHGTAVNNDGSDKMSFGAPSVEGQSAAIVQAMTLAGVSPVDVSYVEAHGTGTAIGDPVEVAALNRAYRSMSDTELAPGSIGIGSVKSNIGHTIPTAGVAGLIKLALALEHGELPPSINYTEPNPRLEIERTPFYVNAELRPWPRVDGRPRWAGISAFGVGGTNAHLVVGEGPAPVRTPVDDRPRIVVLSGRTEQAVAQGRTRLAEFFSDAPDAVFPDSVATLQRGRTAHPVRAAVVASSRAAAVAALRDDRSVVSCAGKPIDRELVFLIPGQAAQHARMAIGLHGRDPVFTAELDRALDLLGRQYRDRWSSGDDELLRPTQYAQPVLFAVEHALAKAVIALGLRPSALLGHSVGELVAATVAGVFELEDALRLVATRARLMQECEPGSMCAVRASVGTVAELLPEGFSVAVVNGPAQVVVAGPADPSVLLDVLAAAGITARRLPTSHGFHSLAMAPAVEPFAAAFEGVELREPDIPICSAATGGLLTGAEATDPAFWARQLVEPVRFDRALDLAAAAGPRTFVEVGPGRALTGLAARHPAVAGGDSIAVPLLPRADADDRDDERSLLGALATLWVHGHQPEWAALRPGVPLRRVPVPGYPYQRVRSWIDPKTGPASVERPVVEDPSAPDPVSIAPAVVAEPASPFATLTWAELPPEEPAPLGASGHALVLVPDDRAESLTLVSALRRAGHQVVRVRPGAAFAQADDEFVVRPGVSSDVDTLLDTLAAAGRSPSLLVHGWAFGRWEPVSAESSGAQLDLAFHGLQTLVNAAATRGPVPDVLVVTSAAVDVSGGESAHPVKAMLPAQVRTMAAENPGLRCALVDLAHDDEDELAAELGARSKETVIALRAGRRWAPRELSLRPNAAVSPLRRGGVYLLTGGLGGLGTAVARALADTGLRPRLVLATRSAERATDDRTTAAIAQLEAMGAQVRVQTCDVTDPRAVARLLDVTSARLGPVNGVLHLAGVPGAGILARRERHEVAQVCGPKVEGTLVLAEAFAARPPLDFFVSFSSRAALAGMVGSGDYAAANAFLDSHAAAARTDPALGRTLSIGWPAWAGAGMAAPMLARATGPEFTTVLAARTCWALDEHRVEGTPVLPGTGHLDLVVRAARTVLDDRSETAVVFEDVLFAVPLAASTAREVRVRFTPDRERHRFVVASRPDGSTAAFVDHVTGHVQFTETRRRTVDVDEIISSMVPRELPSTDSAGRMFVLGPRWGVVTDVWGGDTGKLLRLTLPDIFAADLAEHSLHPSLLDCATAAMREAETDGVQLPFRYRRFVSHAPLPATLFSHLRRGAGSERSIVGDIDLIAPDGTVIGEIEGFTMRRVDRASFGSDGGAEAPERLRETTGRGIDPDHGGRLLLDLLAARTPPHVLVRPFENGAPVPLSDQSGARQAAIPVLRPAQVMAVATAGKPIPKSPNGTVPPEAHTGIPDAVEDRLRGLWAEVLGTTSFASDADFFDLGGDSMSAVALMGRIRDVFQMEFGIGAIFDHPSITALADLVRGRGTG